MTKRKLCAKCGKVRVYKTLCSHCRHREMIKSPSPRFNVVFSKSVSALEKGLNNE